MNATASIVNIIALFFMCSAQEVRSGNLIEVTVEDQFKNILAEKKPVLIDFYATWCGVCKRTEPDVKNLAQQFAHITFIKLDGDKFGDLKKTYKIFGYPTFIILDATGTEIDRIVGRKMESVKNALEKIKKSKKVPAKKVEKEKPVRKDNLIELASAADFDALLKEKKAMVIDFYTTWCGPCKMMKPIIEELSKEYPDIYFVKVDAERFSSVAKRYTIRAYPTFIFLNTDGKQVTTHTGSSSKTMMKGKIDKIAQ